MISFILIYITLSSGATGFNVLSKLKDSNEFNLKNVNELCRTQMNSTLSALNNYEEWAWTMIDASSKLPSGILYGNVVDLGNFDQCLAIEHQFNETVIRGKYCAMGLVVPLSILANQHNTVIHVPPQHDTDLQLPKQIQRKEHEMGLALSICIPNACAATEIKEYLNATELQKYLKVSDLMFNDDYCQTSDKPGLDAGDIAVMTILFLILYLMVASTIYDVYLHKTFQRPVHPVLLVFSILSNGRKLLTVTNNEHQLSCLNGIRFISMMWIVVGHRFIMYLVTPVTNAVDTKHWMNALYSQYIQSAPVAVDTFFFLSGMMISYSYFKTMNKPKQWSFVPMLYLHRLMRITPAVAMLYFVSITIIRHLGSGPFWPSVNYIREPCLKWWWSFYLYIQNYVNYDDMCIATTWYLSADMQLFILSPFIVMPLGYVALRTTKMAVYWLCGFLVAVSILIPFAINFFVESKNIFMTHERLGVWVIGVTTGIILEDVKRRRIQMHINRMLNIIIWIIALIGMLAILLTMHDVRYKPDSTKTNVFDTYYRFGWGLGLAWIIFSCTVGYGGFVNSFLSYRPFQVLSRLCYSMYLVHILVILVSILQERNTSYFSDYNAYYQFCGDFVTTMVVAVAWVLAFESPMIAFEKIIFDRRNAIASKQMTNNIGSSKSQQI